MKKLLPLFLMVCCVMITGCTRHKETLWFDFIPGEVHEYKVTTTQAIKQTMLGKTMEMTQTVTMIYQFHVIEVDKHNIATIEVIYSEVGLESFGPFGSVVYKSWDHEGEIPSVAQAFAVLQDKSIIMRLSPYGKVLGIAGTELIIDEMVAVFAMNNDSTYLAKARSDFRNQFGNKAVIEAMEKVFPVYPDRPVGIGDAWGTQIIVTRKLPMIINNSWHTQNLSDDVFTFNIYGIIETNPYVKLTDIPGADLMYKFRGTKEGVLLIDVSSGWMIEGAIDQYVEGMAVIKGVVEGQEQIAQWPLQVSETMRIETSMDQ